MITTCWILFIVFGIIALAMLRMLFFYSINWLGVILMVVSIIIAAVSAGVLFGGLVLF